MILINISEDIAKSEGISVKKYNLAYLLMIAIIVALGVKVVGGLLTAALVAIPASASRNISGKLSHYAFGAMIIGAISSSLGILFAEISELPAGPLIILVNAFIFLISVIYKR